MGSFGDYAELKVLDTAFSAVAFPTIANHHVGLFTVIPTDVNAGGTEVTGGSYARVSVTNNATTWPAASGTSPASKANGIAITFPAPTANWGVAVGFAIYDAATAGNLIAWGALTVNKTINNGDAAPSFGVGALVITLD